jgi:hypothetical protein
VGSIPITRSSYSERKMLFAKLRHFIVATFWVALFAVGAASAQSDPSRGSDSEPGERTGRVAGNQTVTLAISTLSAEELAARRPEMRRLIPKKR